MDATRLPVRATKAAPAKRLRGLMHLAACAVLLAACATAPVPAGPPAAPRNVTATPGPGYVVVAWTHDGAEVSSFLVERSGGPAGTLAGSDVARATVREVAADARSFVDLDVEPDVDYAYAVTAVGAEGASDAATADGGAANVATGVDLMVGTNDRRYDDGTGTIFIVYYVFPRAVLDDPDATYHVTVEGPPGWNGGDAITFSLDAGSTARTQGWGFLSRNTVDAVAGLYRVAVEIERPAGIETYAATTELLEPDFQLGSPTGMAAAVVDADAVQATWTPPAGTRSHVVSLWRGTYETLVGAHVLVGAAPSHTFTGVVLEEGLHQVEIAPINVDLTTYPVRTEPFGLSYDARPFVVGDAYSPLCASAGDAVDVEDAALEDAIRAATGATVGPLTCGDLAVVTSLEAPDAGIASLAGLEYALNLDFLGLSGNAVSDLTPLSGLVALTGLNLDRNPIPGIDALAALTELRYLSIGGTPTSDLSVVAGMTELELLYAWETLVADLGPLAGAEHLELIDFGAAQVADIGAVADLPALERLRLGWNPIADLTPLHGLTDLRELSIAGVALDDATFLGSFARLDVLDLEFNDLTSIAPLAENLALADATVNVEHNLLDLTDEGVQADVQTLLARGVVLRYEPQRTE